MLFAALIHLAAAKSLEITGHVTNSDQLLQKAYSIYGEYVMFQASESAAENLGVASYSDVPFSIFPLTVLASCIVIRLLGLIKNVLYVCPYSSSRTFQSVRGGRSRDEPAKGLVTF